jgi:hypothetical protein
MSIGSGRRFAGLGCWRRGATGGQARYRAGAASPRPATASAVAVTAGALRATLGLADASWAAAVRLMNGIGMGPILTGQVNAWLTRIGGQPM